MANAGRDDNHVPTMIVALNTDGKTIVPLKADHTNHGLAVDDNTTGSDHGPVNALHDDNHVPTLMALSSAGDGTLVALYGTSAGNLLVNSN